MLRLRRLSHAKMRMLYPASGYMRWRLPYLLPRRRPLRLYIPSRCRPANPHSLHLISGGGNSAVWLLITSANIAGILFVASAAGLLVILRGTASFLDLLPSLRVPPLVLTVLLLVSPLLFLPAVRSWRTPSRLHAHPRPPLVLAGRRRLPSSASPLPLDLQRRCLPLLAPAPSRSFLVRKHHRVHLALFSTLHHLRLPHLCQCLPLPSDIAFPGPDAPDAVDLIPPVRSDYVDAYMPFVSMHRYSNLAFTTITPPAAAPSSLLRRTFQTVAGNPRVRFTPSSHGSKIIIFDDVDAREATIHNSPFLYRGHNIALERFDETANRFVFQHEAFVALSIEDFPLEHWCREHIMHSVSPFGNPHYIDPVCLSGFDCSAVLVVVKVESLHDIPHFIHFKNYDGIGSGGRVHIVHFEEDGFDTDSEFDHDDSDAPSFPRGSGGSVVSCGPARCRPSWLLFLLLSVVFPRLSLSLLLVLGCLPPRSLAALRSTSALLLAGL
ncbi:hypothetical protein GQ55_3G208600 [Panicum hallii var. hallii]|uniref:Uncharacterized protein n=1 Tax=Panicum hallii var. hallii TaxID=1504633 RepID=A0A2T7EBP3_9POAL|nr:hypothetical protein GQ55_3G208600 [Panicum hallii var. hallii]